MTDTSRRLPMLQAGEVPESLPVFEKVAIVGLGLIGGSMALAARQIWPRCLVIGVDDKDVLERAMVRHAIDVAASDLTVIAEADLVVLAAPVRENVTVLGELEQHVTGSAIVTDVGSTKREVVSEARSLPARFTFIGGHPLGGAPRAGIEHARPDLFVGRPWLFTPVGDAGGVALDRLTKFVQAFGAVPHVMTAFEHDHLLAYLSHLPQLTASALMHVVGEESGPDGIALTGRGLSDTTRLASSPVAIWRDICATNADQIGPALEILIAELQELRDSLNSGEAITRIFESAAEWRTVLASQNREKRSD